ncbi:hypothetical protein GOP47_0004921 [Adiantum capillus-veneris]|uniref:Cytochrome P450 n=1 Tax=Adiantum capillus-veneris TaxID=13818 RepID=A0A9D4V4X7_ADICA|nr:hypothetical protein GOP47_0004921 [Adiantum capillus-veneris]
MEVLDPATIAVSIIALLILLFCITLARSSRARLPPSPPGRLPIIGHLHLIVGAKLPHLFLYNLSRKHSCPLLRLQLGQQSVIVASTPAAARHILQTNDLIFAARPPLSVPRHLHGCADILFACPSDPHWKLLRQLCSSQLFIKKRLEAFRPMRAQEVRSFLCSILASVGTPITMRSHAQTLSGNIMCRMAFGKRLSDLAVTAQARPSHRILDLMAEMNNLFMVFNLSDHFRFLQKLDLQGFDRQTRALAKRFDPVLQEIIETRYHERRSHIHTEMTPDFLDLLLQSTSLQEGTPQLSYQNIKAVFMNIFGGGIDTAALTIEWALGELLANPAKMMKLQLELGQVVGMARLVEESDLSSLPYLQAVVKETMRLHPVVPLLVPHAASKACEVMGYQIPADTVAYINVWGIGRDPDTWESPLEFCPERFLGKEIDVNGKHFELLPFGSGRRGCPGWMLGLVMVQIAVASLVQAFEWRIAKELDMTASYGLLFTSSNPLIVQASPKLPVHLFQANKETVAGVDQ